MRTQVKKKKISKFQYILSLTAALAVFSTVVLATQKYLHKNPVNFNSAMDEPESVRTLNNPTSTREIVDTPPPSKNENWVEILGNADLSTPPVIQFEDSNEFVLASIENYSILELYRIPQTINDLTIYTNGAVSYIENSFGKSKLILSKLGETKEIDLSTLGNLVSISHFYSPNEQIFYIASFDEEGFIFIFTLNQSLGKTEIIKTNLGSTVIEIKNEEGNKIYISEGEVCKSIDTFSKKIQEEKCELIKDKNANFSALRSSNKLELVDLNAGEITSELTITSNDKFEDFEIVGSSLYLLTKKDNQIDSPFILERLTGNEVTSELSIPFLNADSVAVINSEIYILADEEIFVYQISENEESLEAEIHENLEQTEYKDWYRLKDGVSLENLEKFVELTVFERFDN